MQTNKMSDGRNVQMLPVLVFRNAVENTSTFTETAGTV